MVQRLRLARVVTSPLTFSTLLYDQIAAIRESGIELTLVSGDVKELSAIAARQRVAYQPIPMVRQPSPGRDMASLLRLSRFLAASEFDIIHSSTPKAGLLSALAGAICSVPIRLHTFTGQRWVTMSGVMRWMLHSFDHIIGRLSTRTYADSFSQMRFLVDEKIVSRAKISVLATGSISGVNLCRFDPRHYGPDHRSVMRARLNIPQHATVIVFVGRVTRDKGVAELVDAFVELADESSTLYLLLVGPFEPELDPLPQRTRASIESDARIQQVGFHTKPEEYLAMADIFCLPSYREGFGTVVIEAGAMGLPTVATSVTGLVDAVRDGETGLLVPARDAKALRAALQALVESVDLRGRMGRAARVRAVREFDAKLVNQAVIDEYFRLSGSRHAEPCSEQ